MASKPTTTKQWGFANKPTGAPFLSGPDATFELQEATVPFLKDGQILCRVRYFSNDTGIRNFTQSTVAEERFYVPTVPVCSPMRSGVIAEVVESASDKFKTGDLVVDFHLGIWSEHLALSPLPGNLPLTHYLGAFGASGLVAYTGLYYVGEAKTGQTGTIVVSAAAGATGSMAVQIAVQLLGAKHVVGIAGSDDKCAWVNDELGANTCVNYKSRTFVEDLKAATPDEVDIYFDNVDGDVLDTMLMRMKKNGAVAVCGAVSTYNSDEPMALRNWFEIVSMRISIRGFIMLDYMDKVPVILGELIGAVAEGKIKLHQGRDGRGGPNRGATRCLDELIQWCQPGEA